MKNISRSLKTFLKFSKSLHNQKGIAFIAALAIMTMLMILGLSFMYTTRMDMIVNHNQLEALRAFYYAESAVAHSMAEIRSGSDVDSDGLGNIPLKDLNSDGIMDYQAAYAVSKITAVGTGSTEANRTIQADVTAEQWTGAIQSGNNVTAITANAGVINGDVDATTTAAFSPSVTINGTVTAPNGSLQIPSPNLGSYSAIANYSYSGWPTWNGGPPDGDGIYYISGNLTISGVNNFTLNGSIIVTGIVQISSMTGTMTIIAGGNNPAIVTGGSLTMTSSSANINVSGLVYAGTTINMSSLSGVTTINGALVSGGTTDMQWVSNLQLTFNPAVAPPYFTGGGGAPTITLWRGHP